MKRFVLNIILFKKIDFRVVVWEMQVKMSQDRKGINNEIMQLKTFNKKKYQKNLLKKNLLIIKF